MTNNDLLNRIQTGMTGFSKGHKIIARYIIEHYDKAAFMTAGKLGATVGVSESTVVRFAIEMGYDGYPRLQKALQELIRNKLTSVQRIEVTNDRLGTHDVLRTVLISDVDKIRLTLEEINREEFEKTVDAILAAKRIYIIGVRSSSVLSGFLGYYLDLIFENVRIVRTTNSSEMFEQIMRVGAGDVVIGISFPRYTSGTVKALRYARTNGAKVIALTDSILSPLTRYADHALFAKSDMASFVDSLVAPLSVINALIVAIGMKRRGEIYETFSRLEGIWEEYGVYEKNDE